MSIHCEVESDVVEIRNARRYMRNSQIFCPFLYQMQQDRNQNYIFLILPATLVLKEMKQKLETLLTLYT